MDTLINELSMILFAFTLLIGGLFIVFFAYILFPETSSKSRVKWVSADRIDGIVFGRHKNQYLISPTNQEGHAFICGATGEGKTSALIIPTLRVWRGTAFCIDISGDLEENCDSLNKMVYDPLYKESIPYNVFAEIDSTKNPIIQERKLVKLAQLLMPDRPGSNSDDRYFNTQGRKVLAAALLTYYPKGLDFCEICQKIADLDSGQLMNEIFCSSSLFAKRLINSFCGVKESTASSCKQACDAAIDLFATDIGVQQTFRRPKYYEKCITPESLNQSSVFIRVPEENIEYFAQLLHIVVAQNIDYMLSRPVKAEPPILFVLDEFSSLGKLDILPVLRRARKRNVRLLVCTQGMADLDLVYGPMERRAMLANFALTAILLATDVETQEYYSRLAGEYIDENGHEMRNIEPSFFGNMGDELVVFYRGGYSIVKRNYYFKQTESISAMPPKFPSNFRFSAGKREDA